MGHVAGCERAWQLAIWFSGCEERRGRTAQGPVSQPEKKVADISPCAYYTILM
jgi:hypothetical protein